MRKLFALLFSLLIGSGPSFSETIRMAVTTSFHNSGLAEILVPAIKNDIDLHVQLLVVGTGQALRLGRAGDVDAILVHSLAAEQKFVDEGFGTHRREIMYNDFVIVGPASDPAQVRDAQTISAALRKIATAEVTFVSRGDNSGTHNKELALWDEADIEPRGVWYRVLGSGMGAALNTASGMNAYILADRASWLNFGNKGELALLYSGDSDLFNQYAFLPINPDLHPHVKSALTARLEEWLTSARAQELINGYTINGKALFKFNATNK